MSRTSLKPAKRVRPAVSQAPRPSDVKPYPRPPDGDGDGVTRECVVEYRKAWKNVRRKVKP